MEDLIRRSDAIDAVIEWYGCKPNDIEAFEKIIEAVPAAESTGDLDNAIYEYVKEGLMANPYDRPQGEWIRTGRTNIYGGIEVQCSNCNHKVMVQHLEDEWYCRHCGADMGMKGADDEAD